MSVAFLALFLASMPPQAGADCTWAQSSLPRRILCDVVDIPAGLARWDARDLLQATAVAAPTIVLMWPLEQPRDVLLQRSLRTWTGPGRRLWTPVGDVAVWSSIAGAIGVGLLTGWLRNEPSLLEQTSLLAEAVAVAQLYHLFFKLLLGREGPENGTGMGRIWGPAGFFQLFPAGTPSGHVATLYALAGVLDAYWNQPLLSVAVHAVAAALSFMVVADNYHYTSDVLWGAGMGYAVGRWVVRHRSSRGTGVREAVLTPLVAPGAGGVSFSMAL